MDARRPGLDFDYDRNLAGNVEDRGSPDVRSRGAGRGRAAPAVRLRLIGVVGDADALMAVIEQDGWNQVHIIARGIS